MRKIINSIIFMESDSGFRMTMREDVEGVCGKVVQFSQLLTTMTALSMKTTFLPIPRHEMRYLSLDFSWIMKLIIYLSFRFTLIGRTLRRLRVSLLGIRTFK